MSPFFVFYGIGLLCLQFIYGTRLTPEELDEYKQIGLVRYAVPYVHLLIKTGYMLPFWLTLQQYVGERRQASLSANGKATKYLKTKIKLF